MYKGNKLLWEKEKMRSMRSYGKRSVGDFIYPVENGTAGFLKKPRWDLVTSVDNDGYVRSVRYFYNHDSVLVFETIFDYPGLFDKNEKE